MLEIVAMIFLSMGAVIAAAIGVGGISRDYRSQKKATEGMKKVWEEIDSTKNAADERDYSKSVFYERPPLDQISAEYRSILDNLEINNPKTDKNSVKGYTDIETSEESPVQENTALYTSARTEKESSRLDELINLAEEIKRKIEGYLPLRKTEKKRDTGTPA